MKLQRNWESINVFCSYAPADQNIYKQLSIHLSELKRNGLIQERSEQQILAGADRNQEIDHAIQSAQIILLLISADFLASDACYQTEMQHALERHRRGEAQVIPLIVRPCGWQHSPFAHLQCLPRNGQPISTWSDQDEAFVDVVAGICHIIKDLSSPSSSASHTTLPTIWNIPYQRNPFFIGREDLLSHIHTQLQRGQPMAVSQHPQAISGLGGIGKTQTAVEYAYRFCQEYQMVLWAQAESTEALISSYVALAVLLNLPEQNVQEQTITVQAVKKWLQTHQEWLLILDNADDLALMPKFLPPTLGGHLLLTTRAQATGHLANRIEVETFSTEDGALFLLRRAGLLARDTSFEQVANDNREWAMQITKALGGLPLALDQAGAYLEETGCSLSEYQHLYQQHRTDLLRERRGLVTDHPDSVATTWSLSFQRVKEKNPATTDLLCLCAFLSPDAIPEEILTASASLFDSMFSLLVADAFRRNQVIEALRAYSLVQRDSKGKTLSIHRLVQAVLQDTLEETEQRTWAERAILVVNAAFPESKYGTWSHCERLLPQALAAAQIIERYQVINEEAGRLLHETASYLLDRAHYPEAEQLYLRALQIREQHLGPEHSDVASVLNGLAILYSDKGKYVEAEPLFMRTLHIREQQMGFEHPDVARPLNGLASLYCDQGKYAEAESLFIRALHIREQHLGQQHPDVAYPLTGLALLYQAQGKYAEAEPFYMRTLYIWEQQVEFEHPIVASTLTDLANLYIDQGKYAEAESLFIRALHIREQQVGQQHPDVAHSLSGLAILYSKQGKYAEAESLYVRALHIQEQHLGQQHPDVASLNNDVANSLNNLALLYRGQGKYAEAEPLFIRALHIWEQRLGPEHPGVAHPLNNLALLYTDQGKYAEAEPLFTRALYIREQHLGQQHPDVAYELNNLALLYQVQGKNTEAEPLFIRALRILEQTGDKNISITDSLYGLAFIYQTWKNYEQAESLFDRALGIKEQAMGPEHPDVAFALYNLANLYYDQRKYEQAEPLFERAISLDSNQPTAYLCRGYVYLHLRKTEQACADFARYATLQPGNVNAAWMVIFAVLGKHHPGAEMVERLEAIAMLDPQCVEAYICRGVALGLHDKPQEGLTELELALHEDAELEDALFWKGMMYAYLDRSTGAREFIKQALHAGLPPILLTPLLWLEQENPHFYQEDAEPLLKQYGLL